MVCHKCWFSHAPKDRPVAVHFTGQPSGSLLQINVIHSSPLQQAAGTSADKIGMKAHNAKFFPVFGPHLSLEKLCYIRIYWRLLSTKAQGFRRGR
jgi:hypothetical protein